MGQTMQTDTRALPKHWPPDDTEESVMGTDFHQATIINLRIGINSIGHLHQAPGEDMPWQALTQTILSGFRRPSGTTYRTLPDVFVYTHPIDPTRPSVSLQQEGPPALIIEVLSESTWEVDSSFDRGKGYSYAQAGVQEYLVLDPFTEYMPKQGRAWRLEGELYQPWEPNAMGRWVSKSIPIAIGFEGLFVSVYTLEGKRQLHAHEIGPELRARDEEIERLRRLLRERGYEDPTER